MNKRILIVDDEESVLNTLKRLFRKMPFDIFSALSGKEALGILGDQSVDLIISDMRMPEMDGAEFLSIAKDRYPLTERILLTGYSDMESTIKAINDGGIFGYLSKPWQAHQLTSLVESALNQTHKNRLKNRTLKHFKKQNDSLEENLERKEREIAQSAEFVSHAFNKIQEGVDLTEQMLLNLLDLKQKGQRKLANEFAKLAINFSKILGLAEPKARILITAARLHAIGKIGLPDEILMLPIDSLSHEQYRTYSQYPANSACAFMSHKDFTAIAQLLLEQKEYLDGSGFPNGLQGDEISQLGKILSLLLDYFELREGITTGEALNHVEALKLIQDNIKRYDAGLIPSLSVLTFKAEPQEDASEMMLPLYSLQEGMILNKDVFSENDILLLPKNTVLSETLIGHLINITQNNEKKMLVSIRFDKQTEG